MEININGYENNRPILATYNISDEAIAEAVTDQEAGLFKVEATLDHEKVYAIMDFEKKFIAMVMVFKDDTSLAYLCTFQIGSELAPGTRFKVHSMQELNKELNY